jgi:hypothetical protein
MSNENKDIFVKRLKSFIWRLGAVVLVAVLSFTAESLGLFGLSTQTEVVLGLILGEVTKYINSNLIG